MNRGRNRSVVGALLMLTAAVPAQALTVGPRFSSQEDSCSFFGCGEAGGTNDNLCDYSSGGSQSVVVNGFGFTLPSSVTSIDGITVEAKTSHNGCTPSLTLLQGGFPVGTTKPIGGPNTMACSATAFVTAGGAADTWGTTWSRFDINNPQFGVRVDNNGCTGVGIDAVRVSIDFTIGTPVCGDGFLTGSEACDDGGIARGDGCSSKCQVEQALDELAQECVIKLNADFLKTSKATMKVNAGCFKSVSKGKAADFASCVTSELADPKGSFAKLGAKATVDEAELCQPDPAFGFAGVAALQTAADDEATNVFQDIFGSSPIISPAENAVAAACQSTLIKNVSKLVSTHHKLFMSVKKSGVAGKRITQFLSAADLDLFLMLLPDSGGKIPSLLSKAAVKLTEKCQGESLSALFPGMCAGSATPLDLMNCVEDRVTCHSCRSFNSADGLGADCDLDDDGAFNSSCL